MNKSKRNYKRHTPKREQPQKDSSSKRVNLDNERLDKFKQYMERQDSNDIRWYTKNKGLFEAATRITWAVISGMTPPLPVTSTSIGVPGTVMAINYSPNFVSNESIVDQCWSGLYSDIVHANSRTTKYDQTDLAIICYAGMEIFAAIVHAVRAYGVMRDYVEDSILKPRKIIEASHFDFLDLKKNFYRMWQDIEQLIVQSRQIWIPNVIPLLERWVWMNSYIYTDSQNEHADYYMYVPAAFYRYDEKLNDKGGGLVKMEEWNVLGDGVSDSDNPQLLVSWSTYISMVQTMIDSLLPDQDRGIIYGDILKCYGKENLFALNQIDSNYTTSITYNPEVLWQIENSTSVDAHVVQLEQNEFVKLVQRWSSTNTATTQTEMLNDFVMNFHTMGQPTSEMIAIATRMMAGSKGDTRKYVYDPQTRKYKEGTDSDGKPVNLFYPTCSGTEIVNFYALYFNEVGTNGVISPQVSVVESVITMRTNNLAYLIHQLTRVSQLDWSPILYLQTDSQVNPEIIDLLSELDNWAPVGSDDIRRVHVALLSSLLGIPRL